MLCCIRRAAETIQVCINLLNCIINGKDPDRPRPQKPSASGPAGVYIIYETTRWNLFCCHWNEIWGWQTQDGQPGLLTQFTFHHRLINWSEQSHLGVTETRWVQRSNPRSVWQQETNTMESRWAHNISLHLHFWLFDLLFDSTWNMDDCKYMWHFYYVNKGEQYSLFQEVTPFILDHWRKKKKKTPERTRWEVLLWQRSTLTVGKT